MDEEFINVAMLHTTPNERKLIQVHRYPSKCCKLLTGREIERPSGDFK
jgi:hypothetical protein